MKIPPGLTCARCKTDLYPHTATAGDDGYRHTHRCKPRCGVDDCPKPHHANGWCVAHNHAWRKYGDPLVAPRKVNADERLEDLRWMAETGEGMTGAAARLGMSTDALENWLRRHDPDCLARLIAHEPKDHNRLVTGVSISELTGRTERLQRRRKVAA